MKQMILDVATNNETSFFRDAHVFEEIKRIATEFSPELEKTNSEFKIWSAACSRGQELYSMIMALEEVTLKCPTGYSILATDISERAMDQAKSGNYTQLQIQRGLPTLKLVKYFKQDTEDKSTPWHINDLCKSKIKFKSQNLLDSFAGLGSFHLIMMRNVLIYQSLEHREEILKRAFDCLQPGGHLILGAAESMIGIENDYECFRNNKVTLFRKPPLKTAAITDKILQTA
jgi:chemotaxis protein methyltransferase CheR